MGPFTRKKKKLTEYVRLISSVSKRPALFKKSLKYAASSSEKENLWIEVVNETSAENVEKAKSRWKSLRDLYKRAQSKDNLNTFRFSEKMQFLDQDSFDNEPPVKLPLREKLINIEQSARSEMTKKPENGDRIDGNVSIRECSKRPEEFSAEKASEHVALRHATSEESDAPIEFREGCSNSVNASFTPDTGKKYVLKATSANRRRNTVKNDRRLKRKEELQMLVLEKIRSHRVERMEPTDMFLFSLAETFKKLDHRRQIRVHRRFVEILEHEYNEQEYTRAQHEDI